MDEPPIGRIRLKRVQLSRLLGVFGIRNTLGAIEADISGDFPLDPDDKGRLVGTGRLRADRIRWTERVVAGTGQGMLRLTSKEVRIEDIAIPMGGGIVRATVRLDRDDIDRSTASLTISNVPAKDLFFTFPDFASQLDLPVDGRFNTTIGREWRGSGVLRSTRGRVYGIPVSDLSLPIDWVVVPGRGRADLHLRNLTGLAASGRVTGRAEINLFADLPPKLASEFRFTNLNATAAYSAAGPVVGSAPITGRLTIAADQLRTSNDLTGKLQATLGEAQPFGLPVLAATAPFFGLARNTSPSSSTGDLKATLGNGVWRVERFALSGPRIDLYSEGTVTTGGRLNLNVVGRSGRIGPGSSIISRVAAVVTQPLTKSIISDTLGALGNFVVYLEVTGTIQSPVVRLQTLRTISEDAFRFIIFRFIAP